MGLAIKALKPIKFLGTEEPENEDWIHIFTNDYSPIKHLTQFKEGYWICEVYGDGRYSSPYASFMDLREIICFVIYGEDFDTVTDKIESGAIPADSPFAEMLNFADNEGSFDWPVAKKLCKDFEQNIEKIKSVLIGSDLRNLDNYIHVLSDAVKCQGVVYYY